MAEPEATAYDEDDERDEPEEPDLVRAGGARGAGVPRRAGRAGVSTAAPGDQRLRARRRRPHLRRRR